MWLGEEDGDVTAELGGASERLGDSSGRGGARQRRWLCSVSGERAAEAGMTRGRGERDRGGAWRRLDASGRGQVGREELASSAARVRARSCSYWQEEDDRRRQVGWASELGRLQVGGEVVLLSLFLFFSVFYYSVVFRALLKILRHFQKS